MKTTILRRLTVSLVSVSVLFSLSFSVIAASPGLSNFHPVNTYQPGQFTDVASNDWFAPNVKLSYEVGILKGASDTFFNASGNVTLAETITMAARLNTIYRFGGESFTQGTPWYQCYVDYALGSGIITQEYTNYDAPATRAQFADIFSRAFPAGALTEKNQIQDGSIPDVPATSPYYDGIYTLYRAGILAGYDAEGTFLPDKNLLRSEASAFISRMVDESLRQSFSLGTAITYYEKDPIVPDFGVVVNASNCTETTTKNSHTYTYHTSWFTLNDLSDWQDLMLKEGFQIIDSYSRPGGYATVYQKGDITVTAGMSEYNFYIVEISYATEENTPSFSSVDDLEQYLNTHYSTIKTSTGIYTVETKIDVNDSSRYLYDWHIQSDMYMAGVHFYNLEYSISISQEDKKETVNTLREYQNEIYKIASKYFPDKKITGGFYSGYYEYPNLHVGYNALRAFSWMNYSPDGFVGIGKDYYDTTISSFHWVPLYDTYDFSGI